MKSAFILLLALGVALSFTVVERDSEKALVREDREIFTAIAIATTVIGALGSFFSKINGPNNVKDTAVYGRPIRITVDEDNGCAVVEDRESGYKSTKCDSSATLAASQASEELFTLLIKLGLISKDDLHHPPDAVTQAPTTCKDKLATSTCLRYTNLGHCDFGSTFFHWMHENCYKSCAACQPLDALLKLAQAGANQQVGY